MILHRMKRGLEEMPKPFSSFRGEVPHSAFEIGSEQPPECLGSKNKEHAYGIGKGKQDKERGRSPGEE